MRERIKKIVAYIFRSWEDERKFTGLTHPRIKILPPFLWELLAYSMGLAFLCYIGLTIYRALL